MSVKAVLADLCAPNGIQTGPFGSQLHQSDYEKVGTPVIMPVDLVDGGVSEAKIARVSQEHVERLSRHKVKAGDLIYARRGDVGRASLIGENEDGWLCGTGCLRATPNANKIDSRYLYYLMTQPNVIGWFVNHAKGTTMLNLNSEILASVPLEYEPDLSIQRRIAGVLSAYDKLIENNRRQIKLLEEAAQRLYKEWFVDLRFPGHETTPIHNGVPEGWKRTTVGQSSSLVSRGVTPAYADDSNELVLGQRCVRNNLVDLSFARHHKPKKPNEKWLKKWDVLINSTGTGSLGRTAQFWLDNNNVVVDSHITIIRAQQREVAAYLGQWAFSNEAMLEALHTGSTGQTELPRDRVANCHILIPDNDLLDLFYTLIEPMTMRIVAAQQQIVAAREARDRLLPKLMSGEIEV